VLQVTVGTIGVPIWNVVNFERETEQQNLGDGSWEVQYGWFNLRQQENEAVSHTHVLLQKYLRSYREQIYPRNEVCQINVLHFDYVA